MKEVTAEALRKKSYTPDKKRGIMKQSHFLGAWWGNLKLVAQHTNLYIQIFILGFSGIAAYGILAGQLHEWGYKLPFWLFALAVLIILFTLAFLEWKLSLPSVFISWNRQWWKHKNPLREEVEGLHQKLDEIKDAIDVNTGKSMATSIPSIMKRKTPPRLLRREKPPRKE